LEIIKIIVVEDSLSMQSFMRTALELNFKNVKVDLASNGVNAMKEIQANPYHIILCDWNIPLLSGDKLLQWVRQTPSLKDIPFIMITGNTGKEDVLKAKELGATDYIVKPVTLDVLMNKLSENNNTLIRAN
jgi:two-component system, chemotaxis family, chemotaxis protein CheY